jgi:hypothetical protein
MGAWLAALSSDHDSLGRLETALAQGADPWIKTAVFNGWEDGSSMTLHEAVLAAREDLGPQQTIGRLSLLALHSRPTQTPYEQRVLARLVRIGVSEKFPVSTLERWSKLTPTPESWRGLLPLVVDRALNDQAWGVDALRWAHKTVLPIQDWPTPLGPILEMAEDPTIRDQYWTLRREAEYNPRRGLGR